MYSVNQPVLNATFNTVIPVLKAGFFAMDCITTSAYQYQNNYKSNSLPAIDKTG